MTRLACLLLCLALATTARAEEVLVFAAASLKESLEAAGADFEASTGHRVVISYAGSNALAKQLAAGAPAHLFISADLNWVDYVEQQGIAVPGSRRNLLANDLVLVARAGSPLQVKLARGVDVAAALAGGRIALANPDAVPAGKYAKAAFQHLGAWRALESRVAATDNVRGAVALVARGEVPLAVAYRTDALAVSIVRIVDTFPAGSHPPILYPMVRIKRPSRAADAFAAYLTTPKALAAFQRFGFRAP